MAELISALMEEHQHCVARTGSAHGHIHRVRSERGPPYSRLVQDIGTGQGLTSEVRKRYPILTMSTKDSAESKPRSF